MSAFPDAARIAAYVGRFGWVDVDFAGIPDEVLREVIEGAWARTAPKKLAAAWRAAAMTTATLADAAAARAGTNDTPARAGSRPPSRGARAEGRAALIPYVVAGYPDADTSVEIALAAADAGADLLEVGLPYCDPLADGATLQRASQVALTAGATLEGSLRLIERIGAARPGPAARADGLRQPGHRRRGRRGRRAAPRRRRRGRHHRRRPDAGRGRAVRGGRPRTSAWPSSTSSRPTTPPERRAAIAARSGGFLYCVSLVGVTGRPDGAADDRSAAWSGTSRAASPVPVGVGFGVSKPAHVRAIAKAGADGVIVASALVDALGDGRPRRRRADATGARSCARRRDDRAARRPDELLGHDGRRGARAPAPCATPASSTRLRRAGPLVDLGDVGVDAPSSARGPDGIIDAANLAATLARVAPRPRGPVRPVIGCSRRRRLPDPPRRARRLCRRGRDTAGSTVR